MHTAVTRGRYVQPVDTDTADTDTEDSTEDAAEPSQTQPRFQIGNVVTGTAGVVGTLVAALQLVVETNAWAAALAVVAAAVAVTAGWVWIKPPPWVRVGTALRAVLAVAVLAGGIGLGAATTRLTADRPPDPVEPSPPTTSPSTSPVGPTPGQSAGGAIAEPAVRRREQWTLVAYQAIDLDSMDPGWAATSGTWTTQDVAYYADNKGDGLNTLADRPAATLPLGTAAGYEACLRAPYRAPGTEPRNDNVNPPRAVCLTTSESRYALIEIQTYQPNRLGVRITVWETV
jgi:hypothetical protein